MKKLMELMKKFMDYMENGLQEAAKADPAWTFMRPRMA